MSTADGAARSFDASGAGALGDVLTRRAAARPLTVGLLGMGYFEYWRMYPGLRETVRADLEGLRSRLEAALAGFSVVYPGMVDTLDRAEEAGRAFADARVDALVVAEGTYAPDFITLHAVGRAGGDPRIVLFNSQTGRDVDPKDDYPAMMRNSALIGISQLTGSFRKARRPYDVVCGEIADPAPYAEIRSILAAMRAVRRLRSSTYGLVGHVFRGMFDLEFDKARVKGFLGPEVMTIQPDHLLSCWRDADPDAVEAAAAALSARFASKKVSADDIRRSCRVGAAMKKLAADFNLDGLCFLGQHYIEKMTHAPARMGASLMLEEGGPPVACEGDVAGLVMMDLMREFAGNPPLQAEWGQFDERRNAVLLLGHGIASPALARSDADVVLTASPEEWGFEGNGLNYEMIMKPGPVTMGHILAAGESWRMFVSTGEALDFPRIPCDEIHALVRVGTPVAEYLRRVLEQGVSHHLVVVHGTVAAELRRAAAAMRIEHTEIR